MEKKKPHYKLDMVKTLIKEQRATTTTTAISGAVKLGLDREAIFNTVLNLTSKDFYKSMTSYEDHTRWQDVYKPCIKQGNVYLKFTVIDDVLILSFKTL